MMNVLHAEPNCRLSIKIAFSQTNKHYTNSASASNFTIFVFLLACISIWNAVQYHGR